MNHFPAECVIPYMWGAAAVEVTVKIKHQWWWCRIFLLLDEAVR